jgi:hypothetical protein
MAIKCKKCKRTESYVSCKRTESYVSCKQCNSNFHAECVGLNNDRYNCMVQEGSGCVNPADLNQLTVPVAWMMYCQLNAVTPNLSICLPSNLKKL